MSSYSQAVPGAHVSKKKSGWHSRIPNPWTGMPFANSATRREAKALLFQELAVAVKHGMPLDEALESCLRTEKTRLDILFERRSGAGFFFTWFMLFAYLLMASTGGIILLLFFSSWAKDVERVARVLADRLLPYVRQGHSLADAMRLLPSDYSVEEAETIRAGEHWGNLWGALESVGKFQYFEREVQRHWARMIYPLSLFLLVMTIANFMVHFIVPKFKDIYDQMGAELPGPTQLVIDMGMSFFALSNYFLGLAVGAIVCILILRMFLVGNRFIRNLGLAMIMILIGWIGAASITTLLESDFLSVSIFGGIIIFAVIVLGCGVLCLYLFKGIERVVLLIEDLAGSIFGYIPLLGAPRLTEMESRWLAALATGISSGASPADAVEAAGNICRGRIMRRSAEAASLIRQGHSTGSAVIKAGVLRDQYANRLRLLDDRPDYVCGLADIADDAARDSYQTLTRATRLAEVLSVFIIGIVVGLFTIAVYLPLFNIPKIVGIDY